MHAGVVKLDIVRQNVPVKAKSLPPHLASGHLDTVLWAVQCSVQRGYGATLEGIEEDRALKDIEHLAVSRSRVWNDTLILTEEPRRLFLDSRGRPRRGEPRVRRRMLASRLLVATQRQQVGTSGYHASSSRGALPVNVVPNESTPFFLIGLDVIREHGTGHRPPPQSRQRDTSRNVTCRVQFVPTRHLASEMMPSRSEEGQRPASHAPLDVALGPTSKGTREWNAFA